MFFAALGTWVEQRGSFSCHQIEGHNARGFALIAAITTERQVFSSSRAAKAVRDDVVNGERVGGIMCLRAAIFAAVPGALADQTA